MDKTSLVTVRSFSVGLMFNPDVLQESVMGFRFDPLIHRMIDKYGWNLESAEQAFVDLKRFLFLCGAGTNGPYVPSPVIDDWWHNFILFTEDYLIFCKKHFGRFVHHHPRRREDRPSTRDLVLSTIEAARTAFGSLSPNWNYVDRFGKTLEANTYIGGNFSTDDCRRECEDCRTGGSCQDKDCHDS